MTKEQIRKTLKSIQRKNSKHDRAVFDREDGEYCKVYYAPVFLPKVGEDEYEGDVFVLTYSNYKGACVRIYDKRNEELRTLPNGGFIYDIVGVLVDDIADFLKTE